MRSVVILVLALASVAFSAPMPSGFWPMQGYNPQHTGLTGFVGPAGSVVSLNWTFQTGAEVLTSPVIDMQGYIYFGSDDGNFYKVNPMAGGSVWNFTAGSDVEGSPAIWNDRVFFGSDGDTFFAVALSNGQQLWNFTTQDDVEAGAVTGGPNWDTVYFGDNEGWVYGLSASTGAQLWAYQTQDDIRTAPAVSLDGTVVYVGSEDNNLYALNAVSGAVNWNATLQGSCQSSPIVDLLGNIYTGDDEGYYYKISPTGNILWSVQPSQSDDDIQSSGCLSAKGDVVYIGSDSDYVYALSTTSGSVLWSFQTQSSVTSALTLDKAGTLYVGSDDDNVYALNSMTGAQYWNFTTGDDVFFTAISPFGQLIVASEDDSVYSLTM